MGVGGVVREWGGGGGAGWEAWACEGGVGVGMGEEIGENTCVHDNVQSSQEIMGGGTEHIKWAHDDTSVHDKIQSSEETMGAGKAQIKWAGDATCIHDDVQSSEEIMGGAIAHIK